MLYVGIDWAYRRAAWCAKGRGGEIQAEGVTPADDDGLAKLVLALGPQATACVEMMSGAVGSGTQDLVRAPQFGDLLAQLADLLPLPA